MIHVINKTTLKNYKYNFHFDGVIIKRGHKISQNRNIIKFT